MALSDPRISYGVHSFAPYNRSTGLPYGISKVLGSSSFNLSGELQSLFGGSNRFAWAVEDGNITAELALVMKELPDFMFEIFLGKAVTNNSAESGASVTSITNKNGTSVVDSSTGIASVGVESGEEADAKFAYYVVVAVSSTTVDVYALSDVDFARGDDVEYQDDALKITASALTITASTAVSIPNTGLELTGGSGTIGMTTGDTAVFSSRPINTKSMDVSIGGSTDVFPSFGAFILGQQKGSGEMFEVQVYNAKALGAPVGFDEKAFGEVEVTAQAFYDSAENKVATFRHVTP